MSEREREREGGGGEREREHAYLPPSRPHAGMVKEIHGTHKLTYHPVEGDTEKVFEVDFSPPFRRVRMIPELEKQLNVTFPPAKDFHTPGEYSMHIISIRCFLI